MIVPDTKKWAASHGLSVEDTVPPIEEYNESYNRSAEEVAIRTIALHCVAAVGYGVDSESVIEWLRNQSVWESISDREQAFLCAEKPSVKELSDARWRQEAQWALLWMISSVDALGLPVQTCDTAMLIDEIMPPLGDPVESFVSSALLRSPSVLLAEEDRVYNLHSYARQAHRAGKMPNDLIYDVLFQRHYAFEWLSNDVDWDVIQLDT